MLRRTVGFVRRLAILVALAAVAPTAVAAVVSLSDPEQDISGNWVFSASLDAPVDVLGIILDLSITQLEPGESDILSGLVVTKQVNPVFAPDTGLSATNVFLASVIEQANGTIVTWQLHGLPPTDPFKLALTLTGTVNEGFIDDFGDIFEGDIVEVQKTKELNTLVVPEPATYALFGAGLAFVAWARRRRAMA
jgi:PEP-CTERM motif